MDALRKAEQEKKEAARRLRDQTGSGEQQDVDSFGELRLVPDERSDVTDAKDDTAEDRPAPGDEKSAQVESGDESALADKDSPALTLSPFDDHHKEAITDGEIEVAGTDSIGEQETPPVFTEPGDITVEGENSASDTVRIDTISSDQWAAIRPEDPLSRTDENELSAPHLGTDSGDSQRFEDTLSDTRQDARVTATQAGTTGQPVGDSKDYSPATAQSVFAARRKTSNFTMHTVVALMVLSVIAVISYGIFAYYAVTPTARDLPSPLVARGIEQTDAPPMLPVPGPAVDEVEIIGSVALTDPVSEPVVTPETEASAEISHEAPVASTAEPEVVEVVEEPVEAAVSALETEASPSMSPADAVMHPADADNMLELKPALLKISRSQPVEDKSARAVNDAYLAYGQGRYDTASALYGAVLADNPEHRDALLGMAAVAIRMQQYERAFDYYMRVLRLNPADRVAQTALIGLQTQADPVASESRIRLLLEESPDAPYLHFTLGNLYAAQSRWPDAQQAFFDAHRLDSSHPDYALNLAISLDRLGQPQAARDYYRRALDLAENRDVNFDTAQVSLRLQALSAALDNR